MMKDTAVIVVALAAALLLAACNAQSPKPVTAAAMTPQERQARAMCEDMVATDVRQQAGETVIENCVLLRMREIKAGLR